MDVARKLGILVVLCGSSRGGGGIVYFTIGSLTAVSFTKSCFGSRRFVSR
jgi:hypothetical protein